MITNKVDFNNPDANMYGCLPCPKCGSKYRVPYNNTDRTSRVDCDDCGFTEIAIYENEEEQ